MLITDLIRLKQTNSNFTNLASLNHHTGATRINCVAVLIITNVNVLVNVN